MFNLFTFKQRAFIVEVRYFALQRSTQLWSLFIIFQKIYNNHHFHFFDYANHHHSHVLICVFKTCFLSTSIFLPLINFSFQEFYHLLRNLLCPPIFHLLPVLRVCQQLSELCSIKTGHVFKTGRSHPTVYSCHNVIV